jgi:ATP-dependent RNA helicase DeaD
MASSGGDLPTFDALELSAEVRRAVDELGYVHPTPVQLAVFEPAVRGKDLVVQARTGTGKTAAFGLPLVDGIIKRGSNVVQALVLCPTRELALQVTREIDALAKHRGIRTAAVYGGAPMGRQVADIKGGAQIVVGTPGRVLDHLHRETLDPSALRTFVLDESDEMLSMGFLPQISDILGFLPASRQTLLFSATLPPDIRRVAETRLRDPQFLTLSGDHIGALEINHFVYIVPGDKLDALIQIIEVENPESAIIFCNTKDETKRVAAALEQQGFAADWLNADLPQADREKVMAATRNGSLRFLVATDVASRGIDISLLTHVINHDFPESAEAYVHRTGRTGRAGRTGTALSIVGPRDVGNLYLLRLTYKLRPIERQLPTASDKKTREATDLLRMFTDAFSARRPHPDDLALARRLLSHDEAETIVAGLLRDHLGARPDAVDEATAARRTRVAKPSAPQDAPEDGAVAAEPRRERGRERDERSRGRDERSRARDERSRARPREGGERQRPPAGDRPPRYIVEDEPSPRYTVSAEPVPGLAAAAPPPAARVEPGLRSSEQLGAGARATEGRKREPTPNGRESAPNGGDPAVTAGERAPNGRDTARNARERVPNGREPAPNAREASQNGDADDEMRGGAQSGSEIYVSIGRRDGAKPSDFEGVLATAGIGAEATEYIRVRHRHAFVSVQPDKVEQAIAALNGATIAGRRATAERARRD